MRFWKGPRPIFLAANGQNENRGTDFLNPDIFKESQTLNIIAIYGLKVD